VNSAINQVSLKDYVAAQYCMTCVDQTYNTVFNASATSDTIITDYKNKYTTSEFANSFDGAMAQMIVSGNAGYTFNYSTNSVPTITSSYKYNTNSVADENAFNETVYIEEFLSAGFYS
jgi:hypothetical protein